MSEKLTMCSAAALLSFVPKERPVGFVSVRSRAVVINSGTGNMTIMKNEKGEWDHKVGIFGEKTPLSTADIDLVKLIVLLSKPQGNS